MRTNRFLFVIILVTFAFRGFAEEASDDSAVPVLHVGGCGGVYFLVEPGEFWVEVEKYDLNLRDRKTFLRAILAGPDRSVIAEETLPDDGQGRGTGPGPLQRARLSAQVSSKGVYVLNVTVSEDRYGEDIAWGFRANCARYLVETSRGHRDAAHEEPLVLLGPDVPGDICFMPERKAFTIDISGLEPGAEPPMLYNGLGDHITTLTPDNAGRAEYTAPADTAREPTPWRLHLPRFRAIVHIDGVTRWPDNNDFPNLSLWTPHSTSWFPFHHNRWLLTPYSRQVYSDSDAEERVEFTMHNNGLTQRAFRLAIEFPDAVWPVTLSDSEMVIAARKEATVALGCALPDTMDVARCRLRVTPLDTPEYSTYATITLRRGVAPAAAPFTLPLVLKPYAHENEQFGYLPRYPTDNQVYFDMDNAPFIVSNSALLHARQDSWSSLSEAIGEDGNPVPFRVRSSKAAFDRNNTVYALGEVEKQPVLLYMYADDARLRACGLPGGGALDMEQFSGNNVLDGPPPLVRYTLTARDPDIFWRRLNDLYLLLPVKGDDGVVSIEGPIRLSQKCIGFSAHSGIPSSVISRDDKVHVVWGEATDPAEQVPGVPTFVATYDRAARQLGEPALVGYGPPANDCHNTPSITMDSRGYLHVLIGTHGRTFQYVRSLQPNDANAGWTEPEELGPGLRQTYVGLTCDPEDTLHVVFRLWFSNDQRYFPASHYATLAYMRKRPGEPWSSPEVLVVSPFSEYGIFYHRLTINRQGRLFLSYDCWSTYWFYRTDHYGTRRALMMSPDGGATWRLAGTNDLTP